MITWFERWTHRRIYQEGDDDEILLVKKIWWVCLTFAVPFSAVLAGILFLMGQIELSLLFFASIIYWLIQMIWFNRIKRGIESFGLFSQLFLIIFSFLMVYIMGGVLRSGGLIFFGLVAPAYAVLFPNKKRAFLILGIYFASLAALFSIDHKLIPIYELLPRQNLILFITNFSICTIFWFVALYFVVVQRGITLRKLRSEEAKSNDLLLNILPQDTVTKLKESPRTIIADQLEDVTILFADLVDFTRQTKDLDPGEVIDLLNQTFMAFDEFCERHGLEKIKTIGDCYMAVAGAPTPQEDHVESAANMALDIQEYASKRELQFRIGLHTGPVVAGVIGRKKFSYDLWGHTVNVASRLESEAPPGGILVSDAVMRKIDKHFSCKPVGRKNLKGVGAMDTYLIQARDVNPG